MAITDHWERLKPWPVYLLAAAMPVSLAVVGVAKLLVLLTALACLATRAGRAQAASNLRGLPAMTVLAAALGAMVLSLAWTHAPLRDALAALVKHAKLLLIPLAVLLLSSRAQAIRALAILVVSQGLVLVSAYLLCLGVDLPWVQDNERLSLGTVFSSYLDQSLMTVGLAVLVWHLRTELGLGQWRWAAAVVAALAALNVLLLLPGRSGQFALAVVAVISLFRALPPKRRWLAAALPALALTAVMVASPEFRGRAQQVQTEVEGYRAGDRNPASSAGTRLNFWLRSVQGIGERPVLGHGVGSWGSVYRRLEGNDLRPEFAELRNPHQEFLLWGVELGVVGALLLAALFTALTRGTRSLSASARDAALPFLGLAVAACLLNCSLYDALIGDYLCAVVSLLFAMGLRSRQAASS